MNSTQNGQEAESQVVQFLQAKGYRILARNYRKTFGEIDIIALDKKTLVFVEVKKRTGAAFGGPILAVTGSKQHKIANTAYAFIKEKSPKFDSIRFDVAALLGSRLTHIENAFVPKRGAF